MFGARCSGCATALLLWLGLASGGAAQSVQGEVVGAATGQPVGYVLVLLVDTAGRERARAVTDGAGQFLLDAPGAGDYRLRVLRIGYRRWDSPVLRLASVEPRRYRAELPEVPVELGAVEVEADERCRVGPREGKLAATLWEEAQKALGATQLAAERRLFRFQSITFERSLAPDLSVTQERVDSGVGFSAWPFESLPPDSLARRGFVQEERGEAVFYGPDAGVFFSDAFLAGHCFRAARHPEDSGLLGLRFEPVRDRVVPDIAGVLWIDRATAALRRLEYRYTGLPRWVPVDVVGGRIDFHLLPNGAFVIRSWWIRAPVPMLSRTRPRQPLVAGFKERGGRVTAVFTADGRPLTLPQ